jgi:hypothetical protein
MRTKLQSGNLNARGQLGERGAGSRIILKWMYKELGCDDVDWIHLAQTETVACSCGHGNEPWALMKGGEFLD